MGNSVLIDFLFPTICPVCLKPVFPKGAIVHKECKEQIKTISEPFCMKCGRQLELQSEVLCDTCKKREYAFEEGRCTFVYRSQMERGIKEIKNNGTREVVQFFTKCAALQHGDFLSRLKAEVIVPVPVNKRKLRIRGYNQAELLARGLSEQIGIPVRNLLVKSRNTVDQKDLNFSERVRNLKDAFEVRLDKGVKLPERVLLIDDIYTTGSTIDSCARALKAAGVKRVYFICFAAGGL